MTTVLTIAGSDSSGGAGLQADLKTFASCGVYGASVVTAITAQNTVGVRAILPIPPETVASQIDAVAEDIQIDATKLGMLATVDIVRTVVARIERWSLQRVVLDPVMLATSGEALLSRDAVAVLRSDLVRLATVVTPNAAEAAVLAEMPVVTARDASLAAERILALGAGAVIVKGGHLDETDAIDVLVDRSGCYQLSGPRVNTNSTHGSGCTFAAALAANLALGRSIRESAGEAKKYVAAALLHGLSIGHGQGTFNHFWNLRTRDPAASAEGFEYPFSMSFSLANVTDAPLDLTRLVQAVAASPADGAVVSFLGIVRNENLNRRVTYLEYEAYEPLAIRALNLILEEARDRWPTARLAIHHRLGRLTIGEGSVAIAAASAHRSEAFAACRYAIERVKQIVPIWKHEFFEGGDVWIEGATADPNDPAARQVALSRTCA
jgi:hydroxymethylpyrimidine/phosphomethylpyrimidine kinase